MTRLLILATSTVLLSACGNGGSPLDSVPEAFADGSNPPVQVVSSASTDPLFDDTELISGLPEIIMTTTLADSGIRVGFTSLDQVADLDPSYIERQWQHMQSCTGQVAVAPHVVITGQAVTPLTNDDDVIFNIDGVPAASSSAGQLPIIQVREADFDGSLGNVGFNLRSILGRYLWLSANLAERDYPFTCARTEG